MRFYFVCQCGAKMFSKDSICTCPRCGEQCSSNELLTVPWLNNKEKDMLKKGLKKEGVCDNCVQPVLGADCRFSPVAEGMQPFAGFFCGDCENTISERRQEPYEALQATRAKAREAKANEKRKEEASAISTKV